MRPRSRIQLLLSFLVLLLVTGLPTAAGATDFGLEALTCPPALMVGDCGTSIPGLAPDGTCVQDLADACLDEHGDRLELAMCLESLEPWIGWEASHDLSECAWDASEPSLLGRHNECQGKLGPTTVQDVPYTIQVCARIQGQANAEARRKTRELAEENAKKVCEILNCERLQCEPRGNHQQECKTNVRVGRVNLRQNVCRRTGRQCPGQGEIPPLPEWECTGVMSYQFVCFCRCEAVRGRR